MTDINTEDQAKYRYIVSLAIDVKRTDGDHLTDEENAMVLDIQKEAENAIAAAMARAGMGSNRKIAQTVRKY